MSSVDGKFRLRAPLGMKATTAWQKRTFEVFWVFHTGSPLVVRPNFDGTRQQSFTLLYSKIRRQIPSTPELRDAIELSGNR
eukprot:scaffold1070_cov245-Pinguiococcus_pyrenoidosus.AAC.12